jgi:uncharacterized protein YjiS (DUF1127 family)
MTHPAGFIWIPHAHDAQPRALHRILHTLLTWDVRWRERRHLADLSDEALLDVGRTRTEMDAESRKPFWKP